MAMTYSDAVAFLYSLRWFGSKFGLSNTVKLASLAGNPERRLRFVHVAGTNGKGSTCAMLESIFRSAGLRTGLFTSPHLVAFGERIQVDRRPIPNAAVAELVEEMRCLLTRGWGVLPGRDVGRSHLPTAPLSSPDYPTFFEVVTVMALRYFAANSCDIVLWETGLGGRLDATNIVTPLACAITNIQFDHQKYLGETLADIASEKAGIIKPGVPVITAVSAPEALAVIKKTARDQGAPLTLVRPGDAHQPPLDTIQLPLAGEHQRLNAALSLAVVRALAGGIAVSELAIKTGLEQVQWPGRLQLITRPTGQKVLLDGAHNIGGAEILVAALRQYFPTAKPALVLGILQDKDWAQMCAMLAPLASRILLAPVHSERTAQPHGLAEACLKANPTADVEQYTSLSSALSDAINEPFLLIAGSLYLVGEAMELLGVLPSSPSGERGLNEWQAVPPEFPTSNPG